MNKGGSKIKKTEPKKTPKKVNLTVKVHTGSRKTKIVNSEKKPVAIFDKPEDIKNKKKETRKKLISWKKKNVGNGFIQAGIEEKEEMNLNKLKEEKSARIKKETAPRLKQAAILSEKIETDKRIIMWSGVGFFMILIFAVWIFQIKHAISQAKIKNNDSKQNLSVMMDDIGDKIKQMKDDLEKVKTFDNVSATGTDEQAGRLPITNADNMPEDASAAISSSTEDEIAPDVLELKKMLGDGL